MKKIIILFVLLISSGIAFGAVDYNQLKADRNKCYELKTSQCFYGLINKYTATTREWQNILRYDYACALLVEKNYAKSKENFKTVLLHEKNNQQLIKAAKEKISKIDELYRKMYEANNLDAGNYFSGSKTNYYWKNPYDIKVYIASNTGREGIFKKAFAIWDEKLNSMVNFSYVFDKSQANIVVKYVDSLTENHAGITKYNNYTVVGNKKYLSQVDVEVSLTNPSGGKYTDVNLLSTTLHEIGHALGLSYHSDNLNDIMYYSTETYKNGSISRRDINTLKQLYK